jgi:hypothetical protein
MGFETHLLVVANETLESPELAQQLERRARDQAIRVSLLAPTLPHRRADAEGRLQRMVRRLTDSGIPATGIVGDGIALVAVNEVWSPQRYDEVIVCTLPARLSSWLRVDLASRLADLTGASICHVAASPPEEWLGATAGSGPGQRAQSPFRSTRGQAAKANRPATAGGHPIAQGARRRHCERGRDGSWSSLA